MMGAQNARILVKNQWRTKTTRSVFLVRVHVCEKTAMAAFNARGATQRGRWYRNTQMAMGRAAEERSTLDNGNQVMRGSML